MNNNVTMKYQITENGRVTLWTASVKLCKYWWPFSCLYVILTYGRRLQYISIVLIMSVHASESMKLNNIYMRTYTHTHVSCPALLIVAVETVTQAPIGQQSKSLSVQACICAQLVYIGHLYLETKCYMPGIGWLLSARAQASFSHQGTCVSCSHCPC